MKRPISILLALFISCMALPGCVDNVPDRDDAPAPESPVSSDIVAPSAPAPQSQAAAWLESKLAEEDDTLWVYRDFADGMNCFTQKAWMGNSLDNIPEMDEAAQAYSGITGIMARLDLRQHLWGGYMFLNGTLAAGATDPQSDFGSTDAGMNLTGATKLVFYAKGAIGAEGVEFFMGGLGWYDGRRTQPYADSTDKVSLGTVRLTTEWQRFELPLGGVDLSRVGCGFGWVTNDVSGFNLTTVEFYLDDIHYEFAESRLEPLFLQSYESSAPGTGDAIINNFAYLYDNAAAALALSYAGKHERARQIADAIVYAYDHDRSFTDGRLRNAYSSGRPTSFPGWMSARGEAFARIPGFYDQNDKTWYEDYYAVSTSTGNLAWAILALCEVGKNAPDAQPYLRAAQGLGDFILALEDGNGGFMGGFEGWEGDQTKATYKSTEHNIDLISAFGKLAELTGQEKYRDASDRAKAFVLAMYDPEQGCFYTGTAADGVTVNKDVLPLDCNTWAILALKDDFKDSAKVLAFIEANMAMGGGAGAGGAGSTGGAGAGTGSTGGAASGHGYDFNNDQDGVWFEGTAQVALAYQQAGDTEAYHRILAYLNASANPDGSITAADRNGVTTGFLVSGTELPWKYGKRTHVGATAWLAFAQLGTNPF